MFAHAHRLDSSRKLWFALLLGAMTSLTSQVYAEERQEPLRDGELLTGQRMRYAFRDVVTEATESTVKILSDGKQVALGTVVRSDGWILTKSSQIKVANSVELGDGRQFVAKKVQTHQKLDLALLKIEVDGLPAIRWSTKSPELGAWIVTSGVSPDFVPAVGVLSVKRRAIPRSSSHGYLGVGLGQDGQPRIRQVYANSAAADAGLKEGDLVLQVDDFEISSAEQLVKTLQGYRPGDTLMLRIKRSEEEIPYSVTLMPQFGDMLTRVGFQNQMGGDLSYRRDDFEAVYQHDSVLSPNECGGPVLNIDGEVIGLNIARAGRTESYALPSDLLIPIVDSMLAAAEPSLEDAQDLAVEK